MVQGKVAAGSPLGYSVAGEVIAVGPGIDDLQVGDRVACAGAGVANHAEVVRVPRNLVVPIPDGLEAADASAVTLGAIALQGVRRAAPTLGETFVVIGLGILGQLTIQMLKANGCRVIVNDLSADRLELAKTLGADVVVHPDTGDVLEQVARVTDGLGADGVVIAAATPSDDVVSTAFKMCRRKGRVVLVGDVGLDLNRADFYAKELDFLISTSYGPGRYDRHYEEEGVDYPVSYVRWTENRNMTEVLRMVHDGRLRLQPLLGAVYDIDDAPKAYAALQDPVNRPLMVLLHYPRSEGEARKTRLQVAQPARSEGRVRLALVGGGSFARGMHLPNLQQLNDRYELRAVVSRTGTSAKEVAAQFGAAYASTNLHDVLADDDIDAVLVATRHDTHGAIALSCLQAGKHALVEKPLTLNREDVDAIEAFYQNDGGARPVLLTGYNRRFSSLMAGVMDRLASRSEPIMVSYRMNAGYIPLDHWVHGPQGGGRNIGEACHIYDLFTALTGSEVDTVHAMSSRPASGYYRLDDNFVVVTRFADGSVASLSYTAMGSTAHPKERMDVYAEGMVLSLDDYKSLSVAGRSDQGIALKQADKGHREELVQFADAVRGREAWPIPLWEQLQVARMAFEVQEQLLRSPGRHEGPDVDGVA
jgi:predicted dehydrogenase/threonine dehydrogenase-like Zn-dependent dehydrogenase